MNLLVQIFLHNTIKPEMSNFYTKSLQTNIINAKNYLCKNWQTSNLLTLSQFYYPFREVRPWKFWAGASYVLFYYQTKIMLIFEKKKNFEPIMLIMNYCKFCNVTWLLCRTFSAWPDQLLLRHHYGHWISHLKWNINYNWTLSRKPLWY